MIQIEHLVWDSELFGYKVGKILINDEIINLEILKNLSDEGNYKLIYIFSKNKIFHLSSIFHELKITYFKLLNSNSKISNKTKNNNSFQYNDLLQLAILSGEHSRFKLDKKFKNNEFNSLYECWLNKSLSKEIASEIITQNIDNEIAGFGTLSNTVNQVSRVGLLAVSKQYQGRGIGSIIIDLLEDKALKLGAKTIEIDTQGSNLSANNFYQKKGYTVKQINNIYHYWN